MKLYVWNCELFNSPEWRLTLSALAESEDRAKQLILNEIKEAAFLEEVKMYFQKPLSLPAIYDGEVAFIKSQGIPTLI